MSGGEPTSLVERPAAEVARSAEPESSALVPGGNLVGLGRSLPRSGAFVGTVVAGFYAAWFSAGLAVDLDPAYKLVFWGLLAGPVLVGGARAALGRRWRRRRFQATKPLRNERDARGGRIRVTGVIQAGGELLRTPGGRPGVLVQYQGCRGNQVRPGWASRWQWEVQAVDFCVVTDDGRRIWVPAGPLVLLPHPPTTANWSISQRQPLYRRATGDPAGPLSWIYDEEVIGAGDRVEVTGIFDLEVDPDASAGSDRQPRLRPVLRGTQKEPVEVCRSFATLSPGAGYT
jgi:hypothetical protein